MEKVFFTYRHRTDRNGNRYSPSYEYWNSYPEWEPYADIIDEKIKSSNWKKLAWIEVDETQIPKIDIENEIKDYWKYWWLIYLTNAEAILYMQNLTDHIELSTWVFEISPEINEGWTIIPQETLTIT